MGNDFFDNFGSTLCGICVASSYKSSDISIQFIAKGKLDVVKSNYLVFWILTLCCSLLMTFTIDHPAVNINGERF